MTTALLDTNRLPAQRKLLWLELALWGFLALLGILYGFSDLIERWLEAAFGPNPALRSTGIWLWGAIGGFPITPGILAAVMLAGGVAGWLLQRMNLDVLSAPHIRWQLHVIIAMIFGVMAWYFRAGASLGDRLNYLTMLQEQRWLITSQPLSTLLFSFAYFIMSLANWPGEASLSLVSCLAGVVWVFAVLQLAALFEDWRRPLLWVCGLCTGGSALFFGYVELMAWPAALATLYIYLAQAAIRGQRPVWAAFVAGLAIACHGQMLILGPSLLVLSLVIWRLGRQRTLLAMAAAALAPVIFALSVAALFPDRVFGSIYGDSLGGGDNSRFVPLFQTTSPYEAYTLFSPLQWVETGNLILQTGPWLAFVLLPAGVGAWRWRQQPLVWFYLSILAPALLFLFLWNPDLGLAHDWDLFASPVILALVTSLCLWPFRDSYARSYLTLGAMAGLNLTLLAATVARFAPVAAWDPWDAHWMRLQYPVMVLFGGEVELIGFELDKTEHRPGGTVGVNLFLRTRRPTYVNYTAGLYLINVETGQPVMVAQDDRRPQIPIPLTRPRFTSNWLPGEVARERYTLSIPTTATGLHEVWLALYELKTLRRLPVGDTDHLLLTEITIEDD